MSGVSGGVSVSAYLTSKDGLAFSKAHTGRNLGVDRGVSDGC
jgi:hypothetical protein